MQGKVTTTDKKNIIVRSIFTKQHEASKVLSANNELFETNAFEASSLGTLRKDNALGGGS